MLHKIAKEYKEILVYTLVAIVIGVVIGGVDALFGRVLLLITGVRDLHPFWFIPFLPLAGLLIMYLYRTYSKESLKGMTLVFETGHGERTIIPKLLMPLVMVSTWITHLFGGSAGREGVAVQLGAAVAHTAGRKLKFLKNERALLVIGMAAGFAGLFQTPLAATFFAMEVLLSGAVIYEVFLPALAASAAAAFTSHVLGLEKFAMAVHVDLNLDGIGIAKLVGIGVLFGITGGAFAFLLGYAKKKCAGLIEDPFKRIVIMGAIVAAFLLVLYQGRYAGLGTNLILSAFQGGTIYGYDWILKLTLTILTLSAGFQGGEVTPLFAIGASLGVLLGGIFGLPLDLCAALGYAAVFGSATNTLIAPILIGAEIFGAGNTLYFVIVCGIAFVCNGNKTIYSAQKRFSFFENESYHV